MSKWVMKLFKFNIDYKPQKELKAQTLANFSWETSSDKLDTPSRWMVFVDGLTNVEGNKVDLLLESNRCVIVKVATKFGFPASNNQANMRLA